MALAAGGCWFMTFLWLFLTGVPRGISSCCNRRGGDHHSVRRVVTTPAYYTGLSAIRQVLKTYVRRAPRADYLHVVHAACMASVESYMPLAAACCSLRFHLRLGELLPIQLSVSATSASTLGPLACSAACLAVLPGCPESKKLRVPNIVKTFQCFLTRRNDRMTSKMALSITM